MSIILLVFKAQLISNDSVQEGKSYQFPSEKDDLRNFTGRTAQIMFSNDILRGVLDQLPPSECYLCTYQARQCLNKYKYNA